MDLRIMDMVLLFFYQIRLNDFHAISSTLKRSVVSMKLRDIFCLC